MMNKDQNFFLMNSRQPRKFHEPFLKLPVFWVGIFEINSEIVSSQMIFFRKMLIVWKRDMIYLQNFFWVNFSTETKSAPKKSELVVFAVPTSVYNFFPTEVHLENETYSIAHVRISLKLSEYLS
jgi:hypothetical protein